MATLTEKIIESEQEAHAAHDAGQHAGQHPPTTEHDPEKHHDVVAQPSAPSLRDDSSTNEADPDSQDITKTRTQRDERPELARRVTTKEGEDFLPMGPKLYLIVLSLMLCVFCVALDNTILAVAIPRITDDFHSLDDVGWYISVYLLTSCSFQLFFGKIYSLFNVKWVYLGALFVFEAGSLICGLAPTSTVLIVGRAIAGLGSGGIFSGALITIAKTVPLEKRPIFFGLIGGMYGIASVAGPLMGGAFTDKLTWRWCFYINLPIGGLAAGGLLFFLKLREQAAYKFETGRSILKKLDLVGTTFFVTAIICALLALQWGGVTYQWSNWRIILLFILFGILLIAFGFLQVYLQDNALVPPRIMSQRTIAFGSFFGACLGGSFFIFVYYVPIWFQAIKGVNPVTAGVDSLPLILANVFATILSGIVVSKTGYFTPWFYVSVFFQCIGAGLICTFTPDTSQAAWVGYQFIYALGIGSGFQQVSVAAQAVLNFRDVSIGTAVVLFIQIFGGALFVAVAQNLFTNALLENVTNLNLPGIDPHVIIAAGATGIRNIVSPEDLPALLVAYNAAIIKAFQLGLILSCLAIFGAVGVEFKSIKGKQIEAVAA